MSRGVFANLYIATTGQERILCTIPVIARQLYLLFIRIQCRLFAYIPLFTKYRCAVYVVCCHLPGYNNCIAPKFHNSLTIPNPDIYFFPIVFPFILSRSNETVLRERHSDSKRERARGQGAGQDMLSETICSFDEWKEVLCKITQLKNSKTDVAEKKAPYV